MREAFAAVGMDAPEQASVHEQLQDGSESQFSANLTELDRFCDLTTPGFRAGTSSGPSGPQTWHYLAVASGQPGSLHVQAPDAAKTEAMIAAFLGAADVERYVQPPEQQPPEKATAEMVETVSPPVPQENRLRLRAFLSFRFTNKVNEPLAQYVQRLLELIDVEVITGRSYEPRPLTVKVADRLAGVDFLVLIIGADGESAWTRDEIATARAGGIPVVPLVANGSHFEAGLFGDLEYITFDVDHPGDASIPLIEGVQHVRRMRGRRPGSGAEL
jgi:hypothetical protein